MIKIALLGSLEPIYGLLWLTYNEIGLRQKLISGYIICIIFLFLHSFIPVVWVGGRPKGLPKMTEYQSNPPCRFKEASHPKEYSVVSVGVTAVAAMVNRDYPFLDEIVREKFKMR